ncbi:hypothetical protein N480_19105 [Pseudoalteromonas luteoviolacea S2607]|uniref:glycosyltransferase family 2 protein n=1 Tax=Pseudoalteromonas luteoviolacea TaxID=43657 RepID=UPI0007B0BCF2|nr:glycosyltransferase [Pseudoalteromonas luteoviolacea]KZN35729.1 hypothetical protein N480_19105 [Pseudoalteromonas luteoviolacea S2607]
MDNTLLAIVSPIACNSNVTRTFLSKLNRMDVAAYAQFVFCIDGKIDSESKGLLDEFVSTKSCDSRVIYNDYPMGYSITVNKIMELVNRPYTLLMDSDVFLSDECLHKLYEKLESPQVASVQPLLIYPQNMTIQSYGHVFGKGFNKHALVGRKVQQVGELPDRNAQAITTACQLFKTALFNEVGALDETYYNAYEGMEISLKYRKLGYQTVVCGNATAYHFQGKTRSKTTFNESIATSKFWTRWERSIKNDFTQFFNFKEGFNTEPKLIINVSNLQDWRSYLPSDWDEFEVNFALRSRGQLIECWEELPVEFVKYPGTLLFLCDHFSQLSNNDYWFSQRGAKKTMILDLHGNQVVP